MLRITTDHDTCRLRWIFDSRPELEKLARDGRVMFGTLDTWFIYRLTGGAVHATDYTNAASTGLFNPFGLTWNRIFCSLFSIPMQILPEVRDTNGEYGSTDRTIVGFRLPIRAAVGDQQAALFGHRCFDRGDTKISKGSGAFVDMNVGPKEKLSRRGLFPMVAWVLDGKPTYMLEGYVATAGTLIDWLGKGMGISETPKTIEEFALQCDDSEGVVFIPTPTGIRFPYFNPRMKASVIGLGLSTHRSHLARAVLEGIAFRVVDILDGIRKDTGVTVKTLRVDGGLSRSNVLMQCLADYANLPVDRSPEPELTARGAAYFAGIGAGVFDLESLRRLRPLYDRFEPHMEESKRNAKIDRWRRAVRAVLRID
jgi:glycerol kinase